MSIATTAMCRLNELNDDDDDDADDAHDDDVAQMLPWSRYLAKSRPNALHATVSSSLY